MRQNRSYRLAGLIVLLIVIGIVTGVTSLGILLFVVWFTISSIRVGKFSSLYSLILIAVFSLLFIGLFHTSYKLISGQANREKRLFSGFTLRLAGWFFILVPTALTMLLLLLGGGKSFYRIISMLLGSYMIGFGALKLAKNRK